MRKRGYGGEWDSMSRELRERQPYCSRCGKSVPKHALHCHHVIPRGRAGPDIPINVVVLCKTCHDKEHQADRDLIESKIRRCRR